MTEQTQAQRIWNMNVGAGEAFFEDMKQGLIDGGIFDEYLSKDLTEYFCEVNDDRLLKMEFISTNVWEEKEYLGKNDDHFFTKEFDNYDGYYVHYIDMEITFAYIQDGVRYTLRSFGSVDVNKNAQSMVKDFEYLRKTEKIIAVRPDQEAAETLLESTASNEDNQVA